MNGSGTDMDVRGEFKLSLIDERTGVWTPFSDWISNDILYSWGQLAANQLFFSDSNLRVNSFYLEFENTASPGDPVSVPTFGRGDDIGYYTSLSSSLIRDYLRVPILTSPTIDIAPGFEAYFTPPAGNRITVFGQSSGTTGVHGKTFSDGANSTLCGLAVVAAPVLADPTQDVILARKYYAVDKQVVKQPSSQLGVTYRVTFA